VKGRDGVLAAVLAALLTGALWAQSPSGQAAASVQDTATEAELKAFFLLNFIRFTEWPDSAFTTSPDEFRIGVLGSEAFLEPIQRKLQGKSVGKRILKFVRSSTPGELKPCALVFVSDAERAQIPAALSEFKGRPILTVGESEGFAESGGILNFYVEENKVKYEINPDALIRAQLKATKLIVAAPKKVKDR
jgi:preprotein translocase subunit Sec61beta